MLTPSKKSSPSGTGQPTPTLLLKILYGETPPRDPILPPLYTIFDTLGSYGGPQLSRENQKPRDKTKIPDGKTENLTAKPKTSRQNQNPHGKGKDLTAKPNTSQQKSNTSRQKQILTAKPKLFCFCCEVFGFAVRYFVFAVRFLVLPSGILVLSRGFWFCRDTCVPP